MPRAQSVPKTAKKWQKWPKNHQIFKRKPWFAWMWCEMRCRDWLKKRNGLKSNFVPVRAQKLPKKRFLGSNGHFFMYNTLFWGLKQNLQLKIYLPTKFQTSKIIGLAAMAFFSVFWGVFGVKWPFFHVQHPVLRLETASTPQVLSTHKISDL